MTKINFGFNSPRKEPTVQPEGEAKADEVPSPNNVCAANALTSTQQHDPWRIPIKGQAITAHPLYKRWRNLKDRLQPEIIEKSWQAEGHAGFVRFVEDVSQLEFFDIVSAPETASLKDKWVLTRIYETEGWWADNVRWARESTLKRTNPSKMDALLDYVPTPFNEAELAEIAPRAKRVWDAVDARIAASEAKREADWKAMMERLRADGLAD